MPLPTLKVELDGPTGRGARVWLDGHDISHGLTGLDLSITTDEVNRATIRVLLDSIEIDANTLAVLQAHVEAKAAAKADDEADGLPTFAPDPPPAEATTLASSHRQYLKPEDPCHA